MYIFGDEINLFMKMKISKPDISQLSDYYKSYLKYVPEEDLLEELANQKEQTSSFLRSMPESKHSFAYAPDKWQIKELVGHLCDTERILVYRALRFSRNDSTPLSGFEENDYVSNANFQERKWSSLCEEKLAIGNATLSFFSSLNPETFDLVGSANKTNVSVRALLFFIIAHERHHIQVIKDRYLKG